MEENNNQKKKGRPDGRTVRNLILVIGNSAVAFALYRTLLFYAAATDDTFPSFLVMLSYMILLLGFGLAYLIYNRMFYRKGLTPEQLPDDWSLEKKTAFLEDGKERMRRSSWMLLIIIPLLITFLLDALDLFVIDYLRSL